MSTHAVHGFGDLERCMTSQVRCITHLASISTSVIGTWLRFCNSQHFQPALPQFCNLQLRPIEVHYGYTMDTHSYDVESFARYWIIANRSAVGRACFDHNTRVRNHCRHTPGQHTTFWHHCLFNPPICSGGLCVCVCVHKWLSIIYS